MMRRTWGALTLGVLLGMAMATCLHAAEQAVGQDKIEKVTAAVPEKATAKPAKARRIIVFTMTKGFRHGSIPLAAEAFRIMGEKTGAWSTVISDDVSLFAADKLAPFDAVIIDQCTGNLTSDEALRQGLLDFVKNGKGIVGVHSATDCFYEWQEYGEMMGGYFAGHPFRRISVKLDDPKHPVNAAFKGKGFEISDEIYTFKDPYSRDKLRILASVDWENANITKGGNRKDNDYALSWVRSYGKGRVFYCAFGHDDQIWWNPTILQHYLDGIQFAIGDLKGPTAPSSRAKAKAAPGPNLGQKDAAARPATVKVYGAPKDDTQGWIVLFDGKDLSKWQNAGGDKPGEGWVIKDGAMVREKGAGDIWTKQRFGDFVLDLEFKTEGNSGVFFRTDNPKDCVQTGIEVQVERGGGREKLGKNDVGSIYDCLAPSKNPVKDGQFNHVVITAKGPKITIVINDVQVIDMDLDQWTTPHENPGGSKNKFNKALKDFKREGHIGFQDHGAKVSYRNVKVKPLVDEKPAATRRRG